MKYFQRNIGGCLVTLRHGDPIETSYTAPQILLAPPILLSVKKSKYFGILKIFHQTQN
jgi:hypothetical protein